MWLEGVGNELPPPSFEQHLVFVVSFLKGKMKFALTELFHCHHFVQDVAGT